MTMKDTISLPLPLPDSAFVGARVPAPPFTAQMIAEVAATDAFAKDSVAFAETAARFYLDLAARIRRDTVTAPGMAIAGMVAMADHYQARSLALSSFAHAVRCYPTMAMLARTHKVTL